MDEVPKLQIYKSDTVVKLDISIQFYQDIKAITKYFIDNNQDKMDDAHNQIKTQNITDEWVKHYQTLLIIQYGFDKYALENGMTEEIDKDDPRLQNSEISL